MAQACRKGPTIQRLYTDGAYGGQCAQAIENAHGIRLKVVRRPGNRSTGTLHDPQQSFWQEPVRGSAEIRQPVRSEPRPLQALIRRQRPRRELQKQRK